MALAELLRLVTSTFEKLQVPYLVTGSVATITYGEPRFTNDIDLVVRLSSHQVQQVCDAFPDGEFYVSREAALDAVQRCSQFNIIHPNSGLKVDIMVADESAFNASRFGRSRSIAIDAGCSADFASPEDVILKKLEYYREGGSEKHLRDIAGVIKVQGSELDYQYLEIWALRLGLSRLWSKISKEGGA
jgi:hypothetical protein